MNFSFHVGVGVFWVFFFFTRQIRNKCDLQNAFDHDFYFVMFIFFKSGEGVGSQGLQRNSVFHKGDTLVVLCSYIMCVGPGSGTEW